jgi:hypothetical protein
MNPPCGEGPQAQQHPQRERVSCGYASTQPLRSSPQGTHDPNEYLYIVSWNGARAQGAASALAIAWAGHRSAAAALQEKSYQGLRAFLRRAFSS